MLGPWFVSLLNDPDRGQGAAFEGEVFTIDGGRGFWDVLP